MNSVVKEETETPSASASASTATATTQQISIGHAGFSSEYWRDGAFFPKRFPQKDELKYYSCRLRTCEINTTFYGIPRDETLRNWCSSAEEDFVFAIKIPKYHTHDTRLEEFAASWPHIWKSLSILKKHLGPILFQFPPSFAVDVRRFAHLSHTLRPYLGRGYFAFEFRHESWFCDAIYNIMKVNNFAVVLSSHPSLPYHEVITSDWIYIRFHGVRKLHADNYNDVELLEWAKRISSWLSNKALGSPVKRIFAYFQSDINAWGIHNAICLAKLTGSELPLKLGPIFSFLQPCSVTTPFEDFEVTHAAFNPTRSITGRIPNESVHSSLNDSTTTTPNESIMNEKKIKTSLLPSGSRAGKKRKKKIIQKNTIEHYFTK